MLCEICGTEREYKNHIFPENILDEFELKVWIYKCNCPCIIFDELVYVRDNEIKLDTTHLNILLTLKDQKKAWLGQQKIQVKYDGEIEKYDIAKSDWNRAFIRKSLLKKGQELDEMDQEAVRIHNALWHLIYEAKNN
jgi:hypothetical protein